MHKNSNSGCVVLKNGGSTMSGKNEFSQTDEVAKTLVNAFDRGAQDTGVFKTPTSVIEAAKARANTQTQR